jgi:hypothetical protein
LALEQLDPELALQPADVLADCGLSAAEPARGGAEAVAIVDGDQAAKVLECHKDLL